MTDLCSSLEHCLTCRHFDLSKNILRNYNFFHKKTIPNNNNNNNNNNQHILNDSKTRRKNLTKAWIDYIKAYDIVPHSWIINCLKIYKISLEVINFIEKTMKTWTVELTAGGRSLTEIKIQRGIFQGNVLSPLLFIIAMIPLNHILRKCTAGYKLSRSQKKRSIT